MELSERKSRILQAVIDDYIDTAEPVSSKEIQGKYLPEFSSATIRNELAALEEMGYLIQPHISAGRVPSPAAYKLYVGKLMKNKALTAGEMTQIKNYLTDKAAHVEDIVRRTAKIISDVTNYTSVILVKNVEKVVIKQIKLMDLTENEVLAAVITDSGIIKETVRAGQVNKRFLEIAALQLNNIFAGKPIGDINAKKTEKLISSEMEQFKVLIEGITEAIRKHIEARGKIITEGENKIFDYPEYQDINKVKNFLSVIDTKDKLANIIEHDSDMELSISINKDENKEGLPECSIVTAKYCVGGKEVGRAGVIGPTRMTYDKVFAVLKFIGETLDGKSEK